MGFSEELWDNGADVATDQYAWDELSDAQQQAAALVFGYDRVEWDSKHNQKWASYTWAQLPADIQKDAELLGYNER
jgi:hypothetical protein